MRCTIVGDNGETESEEVSFTLSQWLIMSEEDKKRYKVEITDKEIVIQPK